MYRAAKNGYWPFLNFSNPYCTFGYIPSITPTSYCPPEGKPIKGNYSHTLQNNQKDRSPKSNVQKDETDKKADKDPKKGNPQKMTKAMINIEHMQAGTISNASGIFSGKNIQIGWSSHGKSNSGFGTLGGRNNKVNNNTNVVFDNDQIDTPIDDRDTMLDPSLLENKIIK